MGCQRYGGSLAAIRCKASLIAKMETSRLQRVRCVQSGRRFQARAKWDAEGRQMIKKSTTQASCSRRMGRLGVVRHVHGRAMKIVGITRRLFFVDCDESRVP